MGGVVGMGVGVARPRRARGAGGHQNARQSNRVAHVFGAANQSRCSGCCGARSGARIRGCCCYGRLGVDRLQHEEQARIGSISGRARVELDVLHVGDAKRRGCGGRPVHCNAFVSRPQRRSRARERIEGICHRRGRGRGNRERRGRSRDVKIGATRQNGRKRN